MSSFQNKKKLCSGYVFAMPGRDQEGRRVVFSVARALGQLNS